MNGLRSEHRLSISKNLLISFVLKWHSIYSEGYPFIFEICEVLFVGWFKILEQFSVHKNIEKLCDMSLNSFRYLASHHGEVIYYVK